MIICKHCGTKHETYQPICSACGAPMRMEQTPTSDETDSKVVTEKIRHICRQHIFMYKHLITVFLDGDSIPEKKIRKITKSFNVFPNGKEIYLYCDTSPLNNGKQGFMICEDGVYWQNGWAQPTNRNFISWEKLKEREIGLKKYDLNLGAGDVISLAGLGRKPLFSIIEGIFQRIQKTLKEGK